MRFERSYLVLNLIIVLGGLALLVHKEKGWAAEVDKTNITKAEIEQVQVIDKTVDALMDKMSKEEIQSSKRRVESLRLCCDKIDKFADDIFNYFLDVSNKLDYKVNLDVKELRDEFNNIIHFNFMEEDSKDGRCVAEIIIINGINVVVEKVDLTNYTSITPNVFIKLSKLVYKAYNEASMA